MRHLQLSAVALSALLTVAAHAGQPATPAAMAAYAEQLLDGQQLTRDGPGVTVLVARGDQLLYKGARGMASLELGVPLQPDHLMRIGSVTKQFAAAALLRQIDAGKARLDDPLSKFLPAYPNGSQITLLQLLNHTSGVKSYTGIPGYMDSPVRRDLNTAELINEFKNLPVDFAPGEKWAYNNSGYVLVGAVVEAISGKSWHQGIDELLLKPAHIAGVYYPAGDQLFKGLVQGYRPGEHGPVPATFLSMTQPHAAGALIANTEGLWRWNQVLHGGKLISPASYQRMTTPEGPAQPIHYGLGIATSTLRDKAMLSHGGGINGFVSTLNYLPASQTTVVILRNSEGPGFAMDLVARKLAAFAIGEPFAEPVAVAVPAEQLKSAEGVYARDDDKQTRSLRFKDGVLQSQRAGSGIAPLVPLGKDRFAIRDSLTELQLERGADGRAVAVRAFDNGDTTGERWVRSSELPPERSFITLTPAQKQALVGDYSSPVLSLKVFIDGQGRLTGQAPGQPAFELLASSPRQVHVPQVEAQLDFSGDEGQAGSATLTQGGQTIVMTRKH